MSILVSHPTGNANVRAVLRGLHADDLLSEFWTTVSIPSTLTDFGFLPGGLRRKMSQRVFDEVPWESTRITPITEIARLSMRAIGRAARIQSEPHWASVDKMYENFDRAVAKRVSSMKAKTSAVYAYEDGAYHTFNAAEQMGVTRIYDLPIAHWKTLRTLLSEEAERLPEWAPTMKGLSDSSLKLERKDREIGLADHILVASTFTRDSIKRVFGDVTVHVTPYGCPSSVNQRPACRSKDTPIEMFYAGHLNQRKGLADLISAVEMLEIDWRLTMAGPKPATAPAVLDDFLDHPKVEWLGVLPHQTLMERMKNAHIFVFPSLVEGFGMVITEALAAGLPVITTPNTCGPDVLTDGVDGFIIPIRSPEAIVKKVTLLADDEVARRKMSLSAIETARKLRWSVYERQVAELARDFLK